MLIGKLFTCLLLMGSYSLKTVCQYDPGNLPKNVLFSDQIKKKPKISPDGKKIAYLALDDFGVMNIWVMPLNHTEQKYLLTKNNSIRIHDFFWGKDSAQILYLQDKKKNTDWHLHQIRLDDNICVDLTPLENIKVQKLYLHTDYPDEAVIVAYNKDKQALILLRIDLETAERTTLWQATSKQTALYIDNAMTMRAYISTNEDGSQDLYLKQQDQWKKFLHTNADNIDFKVLGFSHDNETFWLKTSLNAPSSRLVEIDTDGIKKSVLCENRQYDLDDIIVHPKTNKLLAAHYYGVRKEWKIYDKSFDKDFTIIKTFTRGDIELINSDDKGRRWIVRYFYDDRPDSYYLFDRKTKTNRFLFCQNDHIKLYALSRTIPIKFTARDGMTLHGYITLPRGKKTNLPTVIMIKKDPRQRHHWGYSKTIQLLTNRGYCVLQINHRGTYGYGKFYFNAGKKQWALKMNNDLIDAKRWATEQGYTDPSKVAVIGKGYGGYAAVAALSFSPNDFTCAIASLAPLDLTKFLRSKNTLFPCCQSFITHFVGDINKEQAHIKMISPLFHVDRISRPLMLFSFMKADKELLDDSQKIEGMLKKKKKPVQHETFSDEGEVFNSYHNRLIWCDGVEKFLHKHLGGREEKNIK